MSGSTATDGRKGQNGQVYGFAKTAYETFGSLTPAERERLLFEQLPQVRYIAKRVHDRLPPHVLLDDLIHAGILGLIEAIQRFDPTRHVELKAYAKHRIHGAILDSLRSLDWSPRPLRKKARSVEEAHQRLKARLGYAPSESQMATEMGMNLVKFQHLLGELRGLDLRSLQSEIENDNFERGIGKVGQTSPADDPYALCLRSEMARLLAQAIGELPNRERQMLSLYYYEELTMKEVGSVLGLGEARVSQLHSAAIIRLRTRMAELLKIRETEQPSAVKPAGARKKDHGKDS